jgi:hypothetical protein
VNYYCFNCLYSPITEILGNTKKAATGAVTLTKEQLRDIREKTEKGQKSEAVVIN